MIVRTDAVVLRSFRYGETSRIVSLFTRTHGKVAVLARGARAAKSRFGGTLQPASYVQVVFSEKASRTLQTLREASYVERFPALTDELARGSAALRMVELVNALLQDEEVQPGVFTLLVACLDGLNRTTERVENAQGFFELRLASLLGFAPQFAREAVAALPEHGGALMLETGEIDAAPLAAAHRRASRAALRAFSVFARADLEDALRWPLAEAEAAEALRLVEAFVAFHAEDAYPTRSQRVREQLAPYGS